jgi:hypothetical protein
MGKKLDMPVLRDDGTLDEILQSLRIPIRSDPPPVPRPPR